MINQQLVDFIKLELSKGVDRETIIKNLLENGWNEEDIEEGFSLATAKIINLTNHSAPIPPTINVEAFNKGKKYTILFSFITVVIATNLIFGDEIRLLKDSLIQSIKGSKDEIINQIKQEENTQTQIKENEEVVVPEQELNKEVAIVSKTTNTSLGTTKLGGEKTIAHDLNSIKILSPLNDSEVKVGDTIDIKVSIANFDKLISYVLLFQGESIYTIPASSDMIYKFIVNGEYIEKDSIVVIGNFYDGTNGFKSIDSKDIKITPIETIKKFNIKPEVMMIEKGKTRRPVYEAIFPTAIAEIGETDLIKVKIKDPNLASYDSKTNSFTALSKGETVAEVTYRGITSHMFINVIQYEEPASDPVS